MANFIFFKRKWRWQWHETLPLWRIESAICSFLGHILRAAFRGPSKIAKFVCRAKQQWCLNCRWLRTIVLTITY